MEKKEIDLRGKLCPFPVVEVIQLIEENELVEQFTFLVDDPLAIKSIPEELGVYKNLSCAIERDGAMWRVLVTRAQ